MKCNNHYDGFTLLEMVVAIGIFAVIAAISYASLDRFIETRNLVEARHEKLNLLQTTMTLMGRDMRFMVNRPVRDGYGDPEPALLSGDNPVLDEGEFMRLTTSRPEPGIRGVSGVQRVGWRLHRGELQRVIWNVVDRDQDTKELVRIVLQEVAAVEIRFFTYSDDGDLRAIAQWPDETTLPAGVEFRLTMENGLGYRRLFIVAGNSSVPVI